MFSEEPVAQVVLWHYHNEPYAFVREDSDLLQTSYIITLFKMLKTLLLKSIKTHVFMVFTVWASWLTYN